MNQEALREYCLSLPEVSERFPFQKFKAARNILAFFVGEHMFCYFDIEKFDCISIKAENPDELKASFAAVVNPYMMNARTHKNWIGLRFGEDLSDDALLELIRNSYTIVRGTKKG